MNRNDIEVNFEDTDNIEIELKKSFEKYQQGYGIKITGKTISVDNEVIPSKEELAEKQDKIDNNNKLDADLVSDDNSTHKFVSAEEKNKLSGIEAGAEVNVQADWNEEDSSEDGFIKNKPSIPAEQIQADWNQNDNTKKDFIKNKPSVVTTNTEQEITAKKTFNGANVEFKNSTNIIYTIRRNGNVFEILYNGNLVFSINNQIAKAYNLLPFGDSAELGGSSNKWLNLFLSGVLNDGTNQISVAQMVAKQNSIIAGQDIIKTNDTISVDRTYINSQIASAKDYTDEMIAKVVFNAIPTRTVSYLGYQVSVPADVKPYASLNKLGFMSYKTINKAPTPTWYGGYHSNSGGYFGNYDKGITDRTDNYVKPNIQYTLSFNLLLGSSYLSNRSNFITEYTSDGTFVKRTNLTLTTSSVNGLNVGTFTTDSTTAYIEFSIYTSEMTGDYTAFFDGCITNVMLNEGSTALPYQPYFDGIRDSAITSVVSKDSNNTTLDTFTIDNNIQALNGYGWGINDTLYNYIDFENKKFVQKVGRVDLGSLEWSYSYSFYAIVSNTKFRANTQNFLISSKYKEQLYGTSLTTWLESGDQIIGITSSNVRIKDTNFASTDISGLKTSLNGVYLYYELATPIETDISQYITDSFIEVEAGGYLVAENEYGQSVPFELTYIEED